MSSEFKHSYHIVFGFDGGQDTSCIKRREPITTVQAIREVTGYLVNQYPQHNNIRLLHWIELVDEPADSDELADGGDMDADNPTGGTADTAE